METPIYKTKVVALSDSDVHTIWAMCQLLPTEGIEDAILRVQQLLTERRLREVPNCYTI